MTGHSFQHRKDWLAHLVQRHGWKWGAELGLRNGATFCHLLRTCPGLHLIGVDTWSPDIGYQNVDEAERRTREGAAPYIERAHIIKATTLEAATQVAPLSLDFVFIDADHSTEAVIADIAAWGPKVRKGGQMLGHDINWPSVKAAVDDLLPGYVIGPDNCFRWDVP